MDITLRVPERIAAPSLPGYLRIALVIVFSFCAASASAQSQPPIQNQPPIQIPRPGALQQKPYTLKKTVDMVRLPVTVVDSKGNFIPELKEQNFHILENKIPQKISAFSSDDIPIGVGLVIDNSASMKSKRARVNAAAMSFVQTSNPQDQVFVVNFNDEYYLDMDTDFTNDPAVLKAALERIDSRGGTALYDAILGSMNHLKKAAREKKVLLVVTDGVDKDSKTSLANTVQKLQQSNTVIYAVGLFTEHDDDREDKRQGKKALVALTQATGGEVYFPQTIAEVDDICKRIAQDIRDQYMIGYYPTNTAKDGTYRAVKVELTGVKRHGKIVVRARPGYYAPTAAPGGEAVSGN
ncbi:MAG TPA: VWA domain-containing protein [Candidatus Acidoferrales bacterium]|nr:VWA domain-containing protein [Candidatus Acidoferrales bacterium]